MTTSAFRIDAAARRNVRVIGGGVGLHLPDVDEDFSVAGLSAGG